jgi:hypothetical protein
MTKLWCRKALLVGATVSFAAGLCAMAQSGGGTPPAGGSPPEGGMPGGPGPGHHPRHPLEQALDANGDGVIDAAEIANAVAALKKLDKNGDGKLTADEYRPSRPPGMAPGQGPGQGGPSPDPKK